MHLSDANTMNEVYGMWYYVISLAAVEIQERCGLPKLWQGQRRFLIRVIPGTCFARFDLFLVESAIM